MTVSGNYPTPVQVNGFTCRNCTDVDYAKKHIDPEHPKAGPYGVNAASDPSLANKSVVLGGALSDLAGSSPVVLSKVTGATVDISV